MISVKICGITTEEALRAVIVAKADYAGFVHFPASPRHIAFERAAALKALLPPSIRSVSVLVDPDDNLLVQAQSVLKPDYLQLHGKETPARIQDIGKLFPAMKIIKAIAVRSGDNIAQASAYYGYADSLMFDAKPPKASIPGGNGLAFDWSLLKGRGFLLPWFLSGGLNTDNVAEAIHLTGAKAIDVSSGVERAPGVKDPALIKAFVKAARHET